MSDRPTVSDHPTLIGGGQPLLGGRLPQISALSALALLAVLSAPRDQMNQTMGTLSEITSKLQGLHNMLQRVDQEVQSLGLRRR